MRVEFNHTTKTIEIDGIPYVSQKIIQEKIDGITHTRKTILRPASKGEIDASINKIVDSIKDKVTKEELLRDIINKNYNMKKMEKVNKQIDKKPEIKKHNGCLGFKIGKEYIQLIN